MEVDGKAVRGKQSTVDAAHAQLDKDVKIELPEGDYDTVAGLFLLLFNKVPRSGEVVSLDGWELVATHVIRHRITRLVARKKLS